MKVGLAAALVLLGVALSGCSSFQYENELSATATDPADESNGGAPLLDPVQVAWGDSLYHAGRGGGTCARCHGPAGTGTSRAPDLTDDDWINIDPSPSGIAAIITVGVPKPRKHGLLMPPLGGARLTEKQVDALAAYVYMLSARTRE